MFEYNVYYRYKAHSGYWMTNTMRFYSESKCAHQEKENEAIAKIKALGFTEFEITKVVCD